MPDLALISYIIVMSITPGPNNLMLATSGVNFGLRRTMPHLIGICLGCGVLCLCITFSFSAILSYIAAIRLPLAIFGCTYLLWLSWKIWLAGSPEGKSHAHPMSLIGAMLFQWVNPKAWLMLVNAAILFSIQDASITSNALLLSISFTLVGFPCVYVWALMGDRLRETLQIGWRLRLFNGVMAGSLAITALWLLWDEWKTFQALGA
ncbi:LysE family translocator [Pragia fontium]|uniref:Threonine/homoserine/homoserine lactone efflux protein n=2 Tax=Pragia fontium TaxID=82985 RepID=A0AAJ4W9K7_9GAMM|nr:LysE family translocator [Pragia fontium]GKX64134.1 membrane protein [Pragia fontium]SFC58528.1 Threonine/homoserine/homoserine lactone efflux protein [Pragia fontium DSM 5563 = ATCC 49100]SUB83774.1 Cysteine/O-acetylserine efflux protein [Pragia fontium]VEJ56680.1 Cysteine/O-acetylserine efflux protein [Pragia fontium]